MGNPALNRVLELEHALADAERRVDRSKARVAQLKSVVDQAGFGLALRNVFLKRVQSIADEQSLYELLTTLIVREIGWSSALCLVGPRATSQIMGATGWHGEQEIDLAEIERAAAIRAVRQRVLSQPSPAALRALAVQLGLQKVEVLPLRAGNQTYAIVIAGSQRERDEALLASRTELLHEFVQTAGAFAQSIRELSSARAEVERLRKRQQMMLQFLSLASHQLRTPLSVIKWSLSLQQQDESLDEQLRKQLINESYDATERLIHLVNDVLTMTRAEDGSLPYSGHKADLVVAVKAAVDTARPLFDHRGRPLKTMFPEETCEVMLDPILFHQALQSLLDNALDYGDEGSLVTITVARTNHAYQIQVESTGIPIKPNEHARMFTQFHRGSEARDRKSSGNGLGLYIASASIRAHGGTIQVEADGRRSVFTVTLPIPE